MFLFSLIFSLYAQDVIKVAVVDTGLEKNHNIPLCNTQTNINDANGHGTNISNAINSQIENKKGYCQVIYKVMSGENIQINAYMASLYAISKRKDINVVNLSIAGVGNMKQETTLIKNMVNSGKIVVVAAGNGGKNLTESCNVYPACISEPNLVVVGNKDHTGDIKAGSNHGGPVDIYVEGNYCHKGKCLFGTSQAAAIVTGKIINRAIKTMEYK
jgi:hypothetical protein